MSKTLTLAAKRLGTLEVFEVVLSHGWPDGFMMEKIWIVGLKLGHGARSVDEALERILEIGR